MGKKDIKFNRSLSQADTNENAGKVNLKIKHIIDVINNKPNYIVIHVNIFHHATSVEQKRDLLTRHGKDQIPSVRLGRQWRRLTKSLIDRLRAVSDTALNRSLVIISYYPVLVYLICVVYFPRSDFFYPFFSYSNPINYWLSWFLSKLAWKKLFEI